MQRLSNEAEAGDKAALKKLRREVREASPGVVGRIADLSGSYRRMLAKTASGNDPMHKAGLERRCEMLEAEIAGPRPNPLERLLAERVVSCWLLVELMEALLASQLYTGTEKRVSPGYLLKMAKIQESANRRYLAAIKTLAQVRKLQSNTPGVQFNTQINVGGGPEA